MLTRRAKAYSSSGFVSLY